MNTIMKIKQLLCSHDYKTIDGYEDKKNNCWVNVYRCEKCGKEFVGKHYYPPKCTISNDYCYEKLDNCRLCDTYVYRGLFYK